MVDVDAEDLAEELAMFCARLSGSPAEPPSPTDTYNMPSGPNASWLPLWFSNGFAILEDDRGARRVRDVGIVAHVVARNHRPPRARRRVEDVEEPVLRVVGMEGDAEEPFLARVVAERGHVEERRHLRRRVDVREDLDLPGLLDDEEPVGAVGWVRDLHGRAERQAGKRPHDLQRRELIR